MSDQPQNPTLVIGVGAIGRAVVELISPSRKTEPPDQFADLLAPPERSELVRPLETIEVEIERVHDEVSEGAAERGPAAGNRDRQLIIVSGRATDAADAIIERAIERCRCLLDLGYFVDNTKPTDSRGPRLDIFVIADLGNNETAELIPLLVELLGSRLRAEFRPILRAGEGALAVCPLLVVPRAADRTQVATAVRALAALCRHTDLDRRPHAKVYLVEDQSGKYLINTEEMQRSFAAFLHLLLFSALRDSQGMRELVERSPESRTGPFATFACATLEVDLDALHRACALQLARETLQCFVPGTLPLSEIATEAHPLVPNRNSIESELWKEGADGTLETYLTPPRIAVSEILWTDSPEEIVDHKFGPMWKMQTAKSIDTFRDEVERFKMDRLAQQIERNGTGLVDRAESEVLDRVRKEMTESPRGPLRSLEFTRYAATRANSLLEEARSTIASPNLRRFPPSPLNRGVAAIREATEARPRRSPFRMRFFGGLSVLLGSFLIGALVHTLLAAGGTAHWWLSGLIGIAFSMSTWAYLLWRHIKRHHNWVCSARDDLDQALQRHLNEDLIDYFRRRLDYTRQLWVFRIYRRLAERLDNLVVQLEGGRAAIVEAERHLSAQQHDLLEHHGFARAGQGILYRTLLRTETVDAFYAHVKPPDVTAVAERFLAQVIEDLDPLEAPFADPDKLLAFCMTELRHIPEMSPYSDDDSPLYPVVTQGVKDYLCQLALKLSPPLEVIASAAGNAPSAGRILVIPAAAAEMVEAILADENLDRGWSVQPASSDTSRIHLLIERGELEVEAVACARVAATADGTTNKPTTSRSRA